MSPAPSSVLPSGRLAVVGAGSTYTPELAEGLFERSVELGIDELALHDIDPVRLAPVAGFVRRMGARLAPAVRVVESLDLDEALAGAAFVVLQIRTGGQAARAGDERLGRRHGTIGQETTGPGGFAKALRTIPAVLDIARRIELRAPDAWVINFTNPSGLVTGALLSRTALRAVGLCNIPASLRADIAGFFGWRATDVELDYFGLNHLSWVRAVRHRGRDVTREVFALRENPVVVANVEALALPRAFLDALGALPSDYLRYYYVTPRMIAEQARRPRTRAEEVMDIERELLACYADPAQGTKPAALGQRGGAYYSRAAVDLMRALRRGDGEVQIVNVRGGGALADLPPEHVVEVPCRIGPQGPVPLPVGRLPPEIRGLLGHVQAYEELALRAACDRDRRAALLALATHPLVPGVEAAARILDDIVAENRLDLR
jgi:6-phospho-beta-glucosidase